MQSKLVLPGLIAAVSVCAFGLASQLSAQQSDSAANLADGSEDARELAAEGAWKPNVTYDQDDIVTARGSTFRSRHDNNKGNIPGSTQPNTGDDWELLARGFNPRGPWRAARKYHANDLVTHLGTTFRARRTSRGVTPSPGASWQVFAAKGATGPAGPSSIGDGTQTAPSFRFTDDPDTGMFSPANGKIALVEDGALFLHNLGSENTALGFAALDNSAAGNANTAVGSSALSANGTGDSNTAIGRNALASNTTGDRNTAVGADAMSVNTLGRDNTAVGFSALVANTIGNNNIAVGRGALFINTTGSSNTAVGQAALADNTNGDSNSAFGNSALQTNGSGVFNSAVGDTALFNNTSGGSNTAVGVAALGNNTTGSNNIALGRDAGLQPTAPESSIFIGNPGLAGDTATIRIGIPGTQLSTFVAGIFSRPVDPATDVPVLIDSTGRVGTTASSRRYKFDIAGMPDMSAMLTKLRPVTFRYKQAQNDGSHPLQYGLIAEEVADVLPDLAVFKDGQPETVKYHLLPSFLLAGYQQQQKVIEQQADELRQEKQINASQAQQIALLEQRLRDLEARMSRLASR